MKQFKYSYTQGWGTYLVETLVTVGTNYQDILKYAKRTKIDKHNIDHLEKEKDALERFMLNTTAMVHVLPKGYILWMQEFNNEWEDLDTLVHELNHNVYRDFMGKCMHDEEEAMAYQQEYLFREIRRKLLKEHDKFIKRKKK